MPQDHSKRKKGAVARKAAASPRPAGANAARGRGLRLYLGGVITGVFVSFIAWLATLPEPGAPIDVADATEAAAEVPKPRFDFYTVLPESSIEVEEEVVEPAADTSKPAPAGPEDQYLLQAGSFRQEADAMARRAELILLGLDPRVEEAQGTGGAVFRVFLGPFDSKDAMSRARALTAGENIETLVLKRDEP